MPSMSGIEVAVRMAKLAIREHRINDDDCWYSCPASGKSCNSEQMEETGEKCRCGADAWNAIVEKYFWEVVVDYGVDPGSLSPLRQMIAELPKREGYP